MYDDFSNIQVGDKVAIYGSMSQQYEVLTVTRLTKTQFECNNKMKFRKRDGWSVGTDAWHHVLAMKITEHIQFKLDHQTHAIGARMFSKEICDYVHALNKYAEVIDLNYLADMSIDFSGRGLPVLTGRGMPRPLSCTCKQVVV